MEAEHIKYICSPGLQTVIIPFPAIIVLPRNFCWLCSFPVFYDPASLNSHGADRFTATLLLLAAVNSCLCWSCVQLLLHLEVEVTVSASTLDVLLVEEMKRVQSQWSVWLAPVTMWHFFQVVHKQKTEISILKQNSLIWRFWLAHSLNVFCWTPSMVTHCCRNHSGSTSEMADRPWCFVRCDGKRNSVIARWKLSGLVPIKRSVICKEIQKKIGLNAVEISQDPPQKWQTAS